jgi:transposase
LSYKRLESERFIWPREEQGEIERSVQQLHWLLKGIDIRALRGHRRVSYHQAS